MKGIRLQKQQATQIPQVHFWDPSLTWSSCLKLDRHLGFNGHFLSEHGLAVSRQFAFCTFSRLVSSASPVLTATGFVSGKWQFSTSYRIDTPQPIKTFVTGDYVRDPYSCAKFGAHPSMGASGRMGEI